MAAPASAVTRLSWVAADRALVPAGAASTPTVIDSWLVEDGRTRALAAHARRFATSCERMSDLPAETCLQFVDAAARHVPHTGRWFPRVELNLVGGRPHLHLWLRVAPSRGDTVRVWISPQPDQRVHPSIKGMDLSYLSELRAAAVAAGADEALIVGADGRVREGSTTSILWWRGESLCLPPASVDILPSITRTAVLELAGRHAVPVAYERPRPADLAGLQVWMINALHGIRPVRGWVGTSMTAGAPSDRAARWQALLQAQATTP